MANVPPPPTAAPPPRPANLRVLRWASRLTCGLAIALALVSLLAIMVAVPAFVSIFSDMGEELPRPTIWMLNLYPVGFILIYGIIAAVLLAKELIGEPGIKAIINIAAVILLMGMAVVVIICLWLPLLRMSEVMMQ
jgi:hypothetical protein